MRWAHIFPRQPQHLHGRTRPAGGRSFDVEAAGAPAQRKGGALQELDRQHQPGCRRERERLRGVREGEISQMQQSFCVVDARTRQRTSHSVASLFQALLRPGRAAGGAQTRPWRGGKRGRCPVVPGFVCSSKTPGFPPGSWRSGRGPAACRSILGG